MDRPRILLTNDDGIAAPGIQTLARAMREVGDVTVMAPWSEMSAMGHRISVARPHALREYEHEGKVVGYGLEGTPADCVKFAIFHFMPQPPDLVLSGINAGYNTGHHVRYSGTVSAAIEAAMHGFKAIAMSQGYSAGQPPMDYSYAASIAAKVARSVLENGMEPGMILNVNIPHVPPAQIKGLKVVPVGNFHTRDYFEAVDPHHDGSPQWRNIGRGWKHSPEGDEADDTVLAQGYVSVSPLRIDVTHHEQLAAWKDRLEF